MAPRTPPLRRAPTATTAGPPADEGTPPTAPSPVVVDRVEPCVDGGRYPAKGIVGDTIDVEVVMFAHGHEEIAGRLHVLDPAGTTAEYPLTASGNDRWTASFVPDRLGTWHYSVEAWPDPYATWAVGYERRRAAGTATALDRADGAVLVEAAAATAGAADEQTLRRLARTLRDAEPDPATLDRIAALMRRHADRTLAVQSVPELRLEAHRHRARCSAWYELFPRSTGTRPGTPGTLRDCIRRLPYVAELGFDVLYLPPIHPIGVTNRKGRNNATTAAPGDPGSPWAIGAADGGHTAIAPELGTLDDFADLRLKAEAHGIELALDLAFQCSPDHPWVTEHPDWFAQRSDGSIKYAENPPKRYEDVLPLDFGGADWPALWEACLDVTRTWIGRGVRIFRVDNPHTKPFAFWAWMLAEVRRTDPDVLFLAEAFTRPAVMDELAKIGFHQSYTYFTWRESRAEIEEYFTELTRGPQRSFFRPNVWPNTPDILPEHLQRGGRAIFVTRLVLAAGLAASYGIYGPVFELGLHVAARARLRGVPPLREVRGPPLGPRRTAEPPRRDQPDERDPAPARGAAVRHHTPVPRHRQRSLRLLVQAGPAVRRRGPVHRQPGPGLPARGLDRSRPRCARDRARHAVRGRRPARGLDPPVAGPPQLRAAGPEGHDRPRVRDPAPNCSA